MLDGMKWRDVPVDGEAGYSDGEDVECYAGDAHEYEEVVAVEKGSDRHPAVHGALVVERQAVLWSRITLPTLSVLSSPV